MGGVRQQDIGERRLDHRQAGHAMGLTRGQVMRDIALPQMIRHAIPGVTKNWLVMLKAAALVSIIGQDDMVHRASLASAATRGPLTFYARIGLICLAVTTVSIIALGAPNRRVSRGVRAEMSRCSPGILSVGCCPPSGPGC